MTYWLLILLLFSPTGEPMDAKHIKTYRNKASCVRQMDSIRSDHQKTPKNSWIVCLPVEDIGKEI